jgi:hypothetical protein
VPQDPTSSITDSQIENVGEIQNRGLEIAADATLMRRADLTWTFGAAASFSESEVKDLGGTESIFLGGSFSPGQFIRVGYPLPSYFGQVVQNPDEFAAPVKEEEFIGPMWPTRLINLNTQVRFGDLTLSARMEHQGGAYQLVNTIWNNVVRGTWPGCYVAQQAWNAGQQAQVSAYDRWKCIQGGGYEATAHVYALDYWKLRSVQLTYRAPDDFLGGNLGRLTFTVAARNLLTITDYPGVDPDVGDSGLIRREAYHLPTARALTFGVRSQF